MHAKTRINAVYSILLTAVLVLTAGGLYAKERGRNCGGPGGPGFGQHLGDFHHLDFLQRELDLSDKQLKDIFDITQKYRPRYFESRGNVDKTMELQLEERKEIKKILSDEQQKKFDDLAMRKGPREKGDRDGCPYRKR